MLVDEETGEMTYLDDTPEHARDALNRVKRTRSGLQHANRSHSLKRCAVSILQENLPAHSFVDRCGWVAKNIHTMFEYFFNSEEQDANSSKVLCGWCIKHQGKVLGGIPPRKDHITDSPRKVDDFVKSLFPR